MPSMLFVPELPLGPKSGLFHKVAEYLLYISREGQGES